MLENPDIQHTTAEGSTRKVCELKTTVLSCGSTWLTSMVPALEREKTASNVMI